MVHSSRHRDIQCFSTQLDKKIHFHWTRAIITFPAAPLVLPIHLHTPAVLPRASSCFRLSSETMHCLGILMYRSAKLYHTITNLCIYRYTHNTTGGLLTGVSRFRKNPILTVEYELLCYSVVSNFRLTLNWCFSMWETLLSKPRVKSKPLKSFWSLALLSYAVCGFLLLLL